MSANETTRHPENLSVHRLQIIYLDNRILCKNDIFFSRQLNFLYPKRPWAPSFKLGNVIF